jgi:hypothetical protein
MTTEFANRRWMIFPVSELYKIDWNQVLENQNEIRRTTLDGQTTFVKWDGLDVPSSVQSLANSQGPYTIDQIMPIISSVNWIGTRP